MAVTRVYTVTLQVEVKIAAENEQAARVLAEDWMARRVTNGGGSVQIAALEAV